MDCYTRFAKNLTALRKEENISGQKLSETLGFAKDRIRRFEIKKNIPRLHEALAIADHFNVTVDQMIHLDFTPKK